MVSIHFRSSESSRFHKARSGTYSGASASHLAPTVTTSGHNWVSKGVKKGFQKNAKTKVSTKTWKLWFRYAICYVSTMSGALEKHILGSVWGGKTGSNRRSRKGAI